MMRRTTILIIDPSPEACRQLKETIEAHETLVEVLEAINADQVHYILKKRIPDIVFIEPDLPLETGFTLVSTIGELAPDCRIVVLTANETETCRQIAEEHGITDFHYREVTTGFRLVDLIHHLIRR